MRLNNPLVTSFIYKEKEYEIDLSFDNVLNVFDVLEDKELRGYEKAEINVELLTGESLNGIEAIDLWNFIFEEFIEIKRRQAIQYDLEGNPMPVEEEEEKDFINLDQDAEFIYASFMQAYGINIFEEQGKMHWSEFQSLLNGLPSETIMQRIIQIRLWTPSKHDSSEYKENMKKLQRIYAINDGNGEGVDD